MSYNAKNEPDFGFSGRDTSKIKREDKERDRIQVIGTWDEDQLQDAEERNFCPVCRSGMILHNEVRTAEPFWICGECSTIVDPKIDKPLGATGQEVVSLHDPLYEITPLDDNAPFLESIHFNQTRELGYDNTDIGVQPRKDRIQHLHVKGTQVPANLVDFDDNDENYDGYFEDESLLEE